MNCYERAWCTTQPPTYQVPTTTTSIQPTFPWTTTLGPHHRLRVRHHLTTTPYPSWHPQSSSSPSQQGQTSDSWSCAAGGGRLRSPGSCSPKNLRAYRPDHSDVLEFMWRPHQHNSLRLLLGSLPLLYSSKKQTPYCITHILQAFAVH